MATALAIKGIEVSTAAACRDHQRLQRLTDPAPRRRWMRLAVVLTVLGFTAWAVEWIALNSSGFHMKEVPYDSPEAQAYFLPVPAGSFLSASSVGMIPDNITCPCLGQPSMSWCNFIDFYFITCNQASNYQPKSTPISNVSSFGSSCSQRQTPNSIDFACSNASNLPSCTRVLDIVYDFSNINTYIHTENLASPFRVFDLVSTSLQSSIEINNQAISTQNNPKEYNHSMLVLSLVQSMVAQVFNSSTSSTLQQFWDRANLCAWDLYPQIAAQFNSDKFAFGMTINFQAYSTSCKPNKCFIVVKDGFHKKLLGAMAQVGGVGSLILLGLQVLLWPLVAFIFKFPFEHDVQGGNVAQHISELPHNCC